MLEPFYWFSESKAFAMALTQLLIVGGPAHEGGMHGEKGKAGCLVQ